MVKYSSLNQPLTSSTFCHASTFTRLTTAAKMKSNGNEPILPRQTKWLRCLQCDRKFPEPNFKAHQRESKSPCELVRMPEFAVCDLRCRIPRAVWVARWWSGVLLVVGTLLPLLFECERPKRKALCVCCFFLQFFRAAGPGSSRRRSTWFETWSRNPQSRVHWMRLPKSILGTYLFSPKHEQSHPSWFLCLQLVWPGILYLDHRLNAANATSFYCVVRKKCTTKNVKCTSANPKQMLLYANLSWELARIPCQKNVVP